MKTSVLLGLFDLLLSSLSDVVTSSSDDFINSRSCTEINEITGHSIYKFGGAVCATSRIVCHKCFIVLLALFLLAVCESFHV